ncbi:MAG: response regulator [Myxococcales bacterium FL481]|nr:MAG: response regulator [Myxococcales bacterium FL481]
MACLVLLVDDSRAMRDYVSAVLEAAGGYEVDEVANGFEALRTLPRCDYDLIVTDINMPDVSGIELTRFVRQTKRHATTPVVAISTDASRADRDRAFAAGVTAFLAKPFTAEEFLAVTRQACDAGTLTG